MPFGFGNVFDSGLAEKLVSGLRRGLDLESELGISSCKLMRCGAEGCKYKIIRFYYVIEISSVGGASLYRLFNALSER